MLLTSPDSTGQTRGWWDMGAPDTSDIDLDPANFRCRADLVYCLDQLHTKIGRPSYRDLEKIAESRGIELSRATIGDLIGKNSTTNPSKLTWKTVELFVLACGVPETELDGWRAAWEATMAPERPAWQEERQHLHAKIDQLTAAVEAAETRAIDAEAVLAAYHQSQSSAFCLPEPVEQLRIKADTYYDAQDYAPAVDLYGQIATHIEREHGPDDPRTLQAQHRHVEAETEASWDSRVNTWFRVFTRRKLNARWRHLIDEYQRCLPESHRTILELQLEHIYWVAVLQLERIFWDDSGNISTAMLTATRKLLISLHADCKILLPPGDPFTVQVAEYADSPDQFFNSRPERRQWEPWRFPKQR